MERESEKCYFYSMEQCMNKLLAYGMSMLLVTGKSEFKKFHRKGDVYRIASLSHNYQHLLMNTVVCQYNSGPQVDS